MPNSESSISESQKVEYIRSHIPELSSFKGKFMSRKIWFGEIIAVYHPSFPFKGISINKVFVDPYYQLLKHSPEICNGIRILFRHEIGHAITFTAHPVRSRFFRKYAEAAAELYAIEEQGSNGLVDGLAIMILSHKIAKSISTSKMLSPDNLLKRTRRYIEYHSIDQWHNPSFINGVSKLYPKALETSSSMPEINCTIMIKAVRPKLERMAKVI